MLWFVIQNHIYNKINIIKGKQILDLLKIILCICRYVFYNRREDFTFLNLMQQFICCYINEDLNTK